LKVVSIRDGWEQVFQDYVNRDPFDFYFFIYDWKQNRKKTEILLAMDRERVEGLVLVYDDYIVQLRGSREAVRVLLDSTDLEKVELEAPLECENIFLEKYRPHLRNELILMCLRKGDENIQIKHAPAKLRVEDAGEVAEVMRKADPEWWGEMIAEKQRAKWENVLWLGIKHGQKLVSVGNARFVDFGSNIGVIATDEQHRNMGYATAIVSALVQEIQKRGSTPLIHVASDNDPAIHVYTKVGFKPHKRYLLMRAEKIKNSTRATGTRFRCS
jgi:predicted GNAT family acetyltransferase